jgi:hypothetical protein
MVFEVTSADLVSLTKRVACPHVVILGAGASLAAFPNGDASGNRLPLMNNVIPILGLQDVVAEAGFDPNQNFEAIYSWLYELDPESATIGQIELRVEEYFGSLRLPKHPTLYDMLLLSLREKDAIFTFNWDPFLVDAYLRLAEQEPMPHIFHLHGNVRSSFCKQCLLAMPKDRTCHTCGSDLIPTRLLYPIAKKDYASDPFISSQWDQARDFISRAGIITIFGYSAPTTDKEAVGIFTEAWKGNDLEKQVERVEVIDIRDTNELASQWSSFAFFDHYDIRRSFHDSLLAHYPRRSCEAWLGFNGKFVEPVPWAGNLGGLTNSVSELILHEG